MGALIVSALQGVLPILLMIALGYCLAHFKWITEHTGHFLTELALKVAIPAMMVNNMNVYFTTESLREAGWGLLAPLLAIATSYGIGTLVSLAVRIPKGRRGVFRAMFACANTVVIGLPVATALFGEEAVSPALFYFACNTLVFWTVGVMGIRRDGGGEFSFHLKDLKAIFSPALTSFIVMIALTFADIRLPSFILDTAKSLGSMATPLCLIYTGFIIQSMGLKNLLHGWDRFSALVMAGRFAVTPLIVFAVLSAIRTPEIMRNVYMVQSGMPIMSQTPLVSKAYGSDAGFASRMVLATTVFSLIFVPVMRVILG